MKQFLIPALISKINSGSYLLTTNFLVNHLARFPIPPASLITCCNYTNYNVLCFLCVYYNSNWFSSFKKSWAEQQIYILLSYFTPSCYCQKAENKPKLLSATQSLKKKLTAYKSQRHKWKNFVSIWQHYCMLFLTHI